ncbi:hypothetical protein RND81_14G214900 [Saponaria officinalis]|uniref:Translocon-associated protein subunit alpha n=1 Tax=Saponaria officinalis TaxID=3572 RepID=A0AAW1GSU5_SAPOF
MAIRVLFFALLLLVSPFLHVARCEADDDGAEAAAEVAAENEELGIVNDDTDYGLNDMKLTAAPGVDTVCVFPKNSAKVVQAGEETELLVGIKYDGDSSVNVVAIQAFVHLPYDHRMLVQNLTAQMFNNASVPPSTQATFPYLFAVSKYLQAGTFDLVGKIVYEIEKTPYQSTFYNGTIEVAEASGPLTIETVFLVTLATSLLTALGFWIRGQLQRLSKKSKRTAPKVEIGTRSTDSSMDEWLQGTAYTQSQANKSKKKK